MATKKPLHEHPDYSRLREFKKAHGWELMRKHGAHSLGIGWKEVDGEKTDQPALIFYVPKREADPDAPVPQKFSFVPEDEEREVDVVTDVVESPAAQLEIGEDE